MNWKYAHHKSGEAAICYWAGTLIFVIVLLIETFASTAPEVFSFEWIESIVKITIFTVFIYYCGWLCDGQQRSFSNAGIDPTAWIEEWCEKTFGEKTPASSVVKECTSVIVKRVISEENFYKHS